MAIQTGVTLPTTTVHLKEDGSITETSLAAWSKGRKVVLIVVPVPSPRLVRRVIFPVMSNTPAPLWKRGSMRSAAWRLMMCM